MKNEDLDLLIAETVKDQNKAKRLLDSLPSEDDFFTPTPESEEDSSEHYQSPLRNNEYAAYSLALKEAVEKFLPENEYNFRPTPKQVDVSCDNSAVPYRITAKYAETDEVFYEGEGLEGLLGLYAAQTEISQTEYESDNFYLYDENIVEHLESDLFGYRIKSSESETNIRRTLHDTGSLFLALEHIRAFKNWADLYNSWVDNPKDFYLSYYFVKTHPAMWLNGTDSEYIDPDREIWLWHELGKRDDGRIYHMFETGTAVKPERQQHYHTLELDVYSYTYEEGIVELAWRLNKHVRWDGTPRVEIEPEETELTLLLKERMEEIENNPGLSDLP